MNAVISRNIKKDWAITSTSRLVVLLLLGFFALAASDGQATEESIPTTPETCGRRTCRGLASHCCRLGPVPKCVLKEKYCVASSKTCGTTVCSLTKPFCCEKKAKPYCTKSNSTCFAGNCGDRPCPSTHPHCCNSKYGPFCSENPNCSRYSTCGDSQCQEQSPHCCAVGAKSICTKSSDSCAQLRILCGDSTCSGSEHFCCRFGNTTECTTQSSCLSRQCGAQLCKRETPVCCRRENVGFCATSRQDCAAAKWCGDEVCLGSNSVCCAIDSRRFCAADESSCQEIRRLSQDSTTAAAEESKTTSFSTTSKAAQSTTVETTSPEVTSSMTTLSSTLKIDLPDTTTVSEKEKSMSTYGYQKDTNDSTQSVLDPKIGKPFKDEMSNVEREIQEEEKQDLSSFEKTTIAFLEMSTASLPGTDHATKEPSFSAYPSSNNLVVTSDQPTTQSSASRDQDNASKSIVMTHLFTTVVTRPLLTESVIKEQNAVTDQQAVTTMIDENASSQTTRVEAKEIELTTLEKREDTSETLSTLRSIDDATTTVDTEKLEDSTDGVSSTPMVGNPTEMTSEYKVNVSSSSRNSLSTKPNQMSPTSTIPQSSSKFENISKEERKEISLTKFNTAFERKDHDLLNALPFNKDFVVSEPEQNDAYTNCGSINCTSSKPICCDNGAATYCAQESCITKPAVSIKIWLPIAIVIIVVLLGVFILAYRAISKRSSKKLIPEKKKYHVSKKGGKTTQVGGLSGTNGTTHSNHRSMNENVV